MAISLRFYQVNKCGYFIWGESNPVFGSFAEIIRGLHSWAANREVRNTSLWQADDKRMPTYVYDLKKGETSYLLLTWNEVPSTDGQVASVIGNTKVGEASVQAQPLPEHGIPGYCTAFWLVPENNIFATIPLRHRYNGHQNLKDYFQSYLTSHAEGFVDLQTDPNTGEELVRYHDPSGDQNYNVFPRFESHPIRPPGPVDRIKESRSQIRKVISKQVMVRSDQRDRTYWQILVSKLAGHSEERTLTTDVRVRTEARYTPSESELDEFIEHGIERRDEGRSWEDVGFEIKSGGQNEIVWLSSTFVNVELDIEIDWINVEVPNAVQLLNYLESESGNILSQVT